MGTSLYHQQQPIPSSLSSATMSKPVTRRLEASLSNSSIGSITSNCSRQRSYLTSHVKTRGDMRNKHDPKDSNGVKNSLAKFLAESEDEDLMFIDVSITDKKDDTSKNKKDETNDDAKTVQSDILFNRDALSRAGTAMSRRTRSGNLKAVSSSGNLKAMSSPGSLKGESRKRPERRRVVSRTSSKTGENGDGDDLPRHRSSSRNPRRLPNKEINKNNDGDGDGDGDNLPQRGSLSRNTRRLSNKETNNDGDGGGDGDGDNLPRHRSSSRNPRRLSNKEINKNNDGDGDGDDLPRRESASRTSKRPSRKDSVKSSSGDGAHSPRRGSSSRTSRRISNRDGSKKSDDEGVDSPRRGSSFKTSRKIPNRDSSKKSDDGSENSREMNFDDSLPFEVFEESFNSNSGGGRRSQNTRQGSGSSRSTTKRTSRREAQRKSMQEMELSRTPRSRRSDARSSKNSQSSLSMGLEDLDRQSRKDGKRDRYRQSGEDGENGSVGSMKSTLTARYRRSAVADVEDESVASMRSMRSINTALTARSSYKPSGLEGGALGAFMSNEVKGAAPKKSEGGSVVSAPAGDAYMQERKAQQDMILDTAVREKWKKEEAERERIEKERQAAEEGKKDKRKGLVRRVKSVAKKTAELSRTGSKGALNILLDPKHADDQEQPVRRGRKNGRQMTGADTAKDSAKNEKSVQDIVFNLHDDSSNDDDDESEGEITAYDPKTLSDRQTESLLERWTHEADDATKPQDVKKTNSDQSDILVPALALNAGNGKEFDGHNSWWDL